MRISDWSSDVCSSDRDMAQRAWEAGYFPDHHQRPTVDEFVTALGDTYRGVNRTFRPDDYAELDAYGAARDQRFAVERAKQEGAPLADDMGEPATFDDIIANRPPAHDYDDWTNAVVSKVGNIRVDKLESPQDRSEAHTSQLQSLIRCSYADLWSNTK